MLIYGHMTRVYRPTPTSSESIDPSTVVSGTVISSIDTDSHDPSFTDRLKGRMYNGLNYLGLTEEGYEPGPSARKLRREIKRLDNSFDRLVGELADTGTKSAYLDKRAEQFRMTLDMQTPPFADDDEREQAEEDLVLRMVQPLVNNSGLTGDKRDIYEEKLKVTFLDYVSLSDEERSECNDILDERYAAAEELSDLGDTSAVKSLAERLKEVAGTSRQRVMGGAAMAAAGMSSARPGERLTAIKEKVMKIKQELLEDIQGLAPTGQALVERSRKLNEKGSKLYMRGAYETGHLFDKVKQELHKGSRDRNGRKEGETDAQYEKRMKRNGQVAWLGVAAIAAIAFLNRSSLGDTDFLGFGGDSDGSEKKKKQGSDTSEIPTGGTTETPTDGSTEIPSDGSTETPTDGGNETDGNTGGNDSGAEDRGDTTPREQLFNGEAGSTHLSREAEANIQTFMDDYKVGTTDTRGVWGISEKYLESEGIKNPSVYEIDAVKDHILQHSSLNENSILHPGDTIKLK